MNNTFKGTTDNYQDSNIVIHGAPFDGTVCHKPGTRFAPNEIRLESYGLETFSPYFDKDFSNCCVYDAMDIEIPFGNTFKVLDMLEEKTRNIINDGKIPVMLGGEHLVTLPATKVLQEKYSDLCILQFDAHTDLAETYIGEKYTHATVMKRVWDILGDNKLFQFGIRSGERVEFEFAKSHTYMEKFSCNTLPDVIAKLGNKPVYITIDLDVLDPSFFPGTGTPEPGGISYHDLQSALSLISNLNIVAADVVELSPHYDQSRSSSILAAKIVRELCIAIS